MGQADTGDERLSTFHRGEGPNRLPTFRGRQPKLVAPSGDGKGSDTPQFSIFDSQKAQRPTLAPLDIQIGFPRLNRLAPRRCQLHV